MTSFTKTSLVAAAALLIVAGAASAQTLKADIPFAFHVADKTLPAGSYTVDRIADGPVYLLRNENGSGGAAALGQAPHDPPKAWKAEGSPKLVFRCGESTCTLTDLWDGARPAYGIGQRKNVDMGTRIAVVTMRPEGRAD